MVAPIECAADTRRPPFFTPEDWMLLDALGTAPYAPPTTGRFLTMHKRRRKRLATRSLLQDPAVLDDIFHGQAQHILNESAKWGFNAFNLEAVTGGRSLPVLCLHLFHYYGLLDHFHLEPVRVWKLFALIEEGYHSTNPYHNSVHATDVTQAMHCFLQEEKIKRHLRPVEVMAALIGAVAHDLDHPGVNQHFLVSTSNHLAVLYDNMSVLENHHWRSAVGCLLESGVAEQLAPFRTDLERQIRSLILATDISRQQEFLGRFKKHLDERTLDLRHSADRHFVLQIALKCADISNPTRPWDVSRRWSLKVCEEFYRQGEYERRLNLPVTSMCDRQSTSVAKIQSGFFRFVVEPLYAEWHRFLDSRLSIRLIDLLERNRRKWDEQEASESSAAPAEVVDDYISPANHAHVTTVGTNDRRQSLAVPTLSVGRRHSVPVSLTQPSRAIPRRESLPSRRASTVDSDSDDVVVVVYSHDDEDSFGGLHKSQSSLMSSSRRSSDDPSSSTDRPLSAENLLPEPSIALITTGASASRLTSIMYHGLTAPQRPATLTRQQTFPPPQPYVRTRYMSATADMTTCAETLDESSTSTTASSNSSSRRVVLPIIAVLSPSNSGTVALTETAKHDERTKKARLGDGGESVGTATEKENVDPALVANTKRRGSAPEHPHTAVAAASDAHGLRRGSVPITYTVSTVGRSPRYEDVTAFGGEQQQQQLPRLLTRHVSLNGNKARHKKQPQAAAAALARRLSGGLEGVGAAGAGGETSCWRATDAAVLLAQQRRRGSLPVEVLTVGHSVF